MRNKIIADKLESYMRLSAPILLPAIGDLLWRGFYTDHQSKKIPMKIFADQIIYNDMGFKFENGKVYYEYGRRTREVFPLGLKEILPDIGVSHYIKKSEGGNRRSKWVNYELTYQNNNKQILTFWAADILKAKLSEIGVSKVQIIVETILGDFGELGNVPEFWKLMKKHLTDDGIVLGQLDRIPGAAKANSFQMVTNSGYPIQFMDSIFKPATI